mmetsp:Transcript_23996/g.75114  ORF Transcript_23996/g.75114 Transcript_23996/m.75114 type:complete len:278 (-) Transcript_23996:58-891(-)
MSGFSLPASSTHCGRVTAVVSPTLPPHAWKLKTAWHLSPAPWIMATSCSYADQSYSHGVSHSTMPHQTSTITPTTPAWLSCRRRLSMSSGRMIIGLSFPSLWTSLTVSSGIMTYTGTFGLVLAIVCVPDRTAPIAGVSRALRVTPLADEMRRFPLFPSPISCRSTSSPSTFRALIRSDSAVPLAMSAILLGTLGGALGALRALAESLDVLAPWPTVKIGIRADRPRCPAAAAPATSPAIPCDERPENCARSAVGWVHPRCARARGTVVAMLRAIRGL